MKYEIEIDEKILKGWTPKKFEITEVLDDDKFKVHPGKIRTRLIGKLILDAPRERKFRFVGTAKHLKIETGQYFSNVFDNLVLYVAGCAVPVLVDAEIWEEIKDEI